MTRSTNHIDCEIENVSVTQNNELNIESSLVEYDFIHSNSFLCQTKGIRKICIPTYKSRSFFGRKVTPVRYIYDVMMKTQG